MKTIKQILEKFQKPFILKIEKLEFFGIGNKDVYNISKTFKVEKNEYLFGRVEPRDNSELSKVFLFKKENQKWVVDKNFKPIENSEDPFITKINNELILGCVEVVKMNKAHEFDLENKLNYRTILYKGANPWKLKKFFKGPWKMKDIRFVELPNKKIALFSRPQGGNAGRGKIGFTIINSIEELKHSDLNNADLLDLFSEDEWGGANEIHLLQNKKLFVLGHIAKRNENNSVSYYPMYFTIDSKTKEYSEIKILFKREHLPKGKSKNEKLIDVIFPGGFNENPDGTIDIYIGAGDAEAYRIKIKNNLDIKTPPPRFELGSLPYSKRLR